MSYVCRKRSMPFLVPAFRSQTGGSRRVQSKRSEADSSGFAGVTFRRSRGAATAGEDDGRGEGETRYGTTAMR